MRSSSEATSRFAINTVQELRVVLARPDSVNILLSLDASCVPHLLELLQSEAEQSHGSQRKLCLKVLRALAKKHHILPSSLFLNSIRKIGNHPVKGGGSADIWKGILSPGERLVSLKVLRIYLNPHEHRRQEVLKAFCKEALVWKYLNHPNILPLLGVNIELFSPGFCLVSSWMVNADIITYLRKNPEHNRLKALHEISSGMTYLHSLDSMIIHGDIKGANILVDEHACCRLADFGLATVIETHRLDSTTSSSGGPKGTLSWMAPEMFEVEDHHSGKDVDKSPRDVYAYGCTIFEIITGTPPFFGLREGAIIKQVMSGNRPPKPIYGWCPDLVWDLVERCWVQNPIERPRAAQIERYLERVGNGEVAGLDAIFSLGGTNDMGQSKKKVLRTCQECQASFTSRESFLDHLNAHSVNV